jgi:hypothetical protein
VTNTGDPRRLRCGENPWKSSYSWSSPPLSGDTEPPEPEGVDELNRDATASRRVERRGWRTRRVNETDEKRVKRVDSVLEEHKEAEKHGVEGDAIAIEGKLLRFELPKCSYFQKCVCACERERERERDPFQKKKKKKEKEKREGERERERWEMMLQCEEGVCIMYVMYAKLWKRNYHHILSVR